MGYAQGAAGLKLKVQERKIKAMSPEGKQALRDHWAHFKNTHKVCQECDLAAVLIDMDHAETEKSIVLHMDPDLADDADGLDEPSIGEVLVMVSGKPKTLGTGQVIIGTDGKGGVRFTFLPDDEQQLPTMLRPPPIFSSKVSLYTSTAGNFYQGTY